MDMPEKDNLEPAKENEDLLNYHSSNMPPDWQLGGNNLANASMGLISSGNPIAVSRGNMLESSSCSGAGATMVDSFCSNMWDQTSSSHSLGFSDISVQHNSGTSNALGNRPNAIVPLRPGLDGMPVLGWNPQNSILKGSVFLPGGSGILPQSLTHFPADSGFIERAARYSCFSGGNFSDIMNPFSIAESMNPYPRILAPTQGSQDGYPGNGLKPMSGTQSQRNEMNLAESVKRACLPAEQEASDGSPLNNDKKSEMLARSQDEAKQGVGGSCNESDEAEFSGRGAHEEFQGTGCGQASPKGVGSRKRRRSNQDAEIEQNKGISQSPGEAKKDHSSEIQQKGGQNATSSASKVGGKNAKQGSQASDSPKEEYIHVRARRGQATNSHSLAERVRREKISERMKFLQDLVPGCSKVTGKAVMLDEIINYVQSLQRQVEFLSMKLATVNPRLDFNLEGLLAKDILQSRGGPSSSLAFPPDMNMSYPPLHQSQGIVQASLLGLGNSSDALRQSISSPIPAMNQAFKETTPHVSSVWDDELNNVVQMGLNSSAPLSNQDLTGPLPPGHMKAEL